MKRNIPHMVRYIPYRKESMTTYIYDDSDTDDMDRYTWMRFFCTIAEDEQQALKNIAKMTDKEVSIENLTPVYGTIEVCEVAVDLE